MSGFVHPMWCRHGPVGVLLAIPQGPVFGQLAIEYVGKKGGIGGKKWPPRPWQSVRVALDVGHRVAASNGLGTYTLEFEVFREEPAT